LGVLQECAVGEHRVEGGERHEVIVRAVLLARAGRAGGVRNGDGHAGGRFHQAFDQAGFAGPGGSSDDVQDASIHRIKTTLDLVNVGEPFEEAANAGLDGSIRWPVRFRWVASPRPPAATRRVLPPGAEVSDLARRLDPKVIVLIVVLVFRAQSELDEIGIVEQDQFRIHSQFDGG